MAKYTEIYIPQIYWNTYSLKYSKENILEMAKYKDI